MSIVYLQCDCRYNKWLLEKIKEKYVVECTVEKIKELECEKIIAGIYKCDENNQLIEVLEKAGVDVVVSTEEDVNIRFVELVTTENTDYIIRVSGDLVLFDVKKTWNILDEMKKNNMDFFFEEAIACLVPDIVKVDCLIKYKEEILNEKRYFSALLKDKNIKRYSKYESDVILYDFRAHSNEGYRVCKKVIEKDLNVYELSKKLAMTLKYKGNYLNLSGIYGSWILAGACFDFHFDEEGHVNPFLGKSIIDIIKNRIRRNFRVFEWGSGNSTLFWSEHVKEVVAVEHNPEWFEKMKTLIPNNVKIRFCELEYGGEYSKKILDENEEFDIVMIDGRDRVNCAINAVERLSKNGIIIWDNSEREEYKRGYEFLKQKGFKQLEITGVIYELPGLECFTSVFYREDNVFDL